MINSHIPGTASVGARHSPYNVIIRGRGVVDGEPDIHVLWTMSAKPKGQHFHPNHIVPLVAKESDNDIDSTGTDDNDTENLNIE